MRALRGMIQCIWHYSIFVFFDCLILVMASCLPRKAGGVPLTLFNPGYFYTLFNQGGANLPPYLSQKLDALEQ